MGFFLAKDKFSRILFNNILPILTNHRRANYRHHLGRYENHTSPETLCGHHWRVSRNWCGLCQGPGPSRIRSSSCCSGPRSLQALADHLRNSYSVEVTTDVLDLSQPQAGHRLYSLSRQQGERVDVLINNAGFGLYGPFANMPLPRIQEMLQLHVTTVVECPDSFFPR